MKKQYTKKQIQEAITYWEKQLAEGNYRRLNEEEADLESGRCAVLKIGAIGRWNVFDENGNFIKAADSIETLPALIGQLHIEKGYDTFEFGEDIRNSGRLNSLVYHDGTFIRGKKDVFDHIAHEIAKWAFDEYGELPASTLSKIKVSEYGIVWKKQLDEKDILERGKTYDPYVNGPNLTNVQDLEDECHHFSEMGFGKTRLYLNIDGRDVKLNNFGIEVEDTPRGNKAVLYFNRKLDS